jgi:two-component system, OmpR family, KDP operon response regulator KdpE
MNQQGQRVLAVDDERSIRRFLLTLLSAHNYTVFEAETGREAIDQVRIYRPAVIILDLGLPDIGGVEVTRCLREWTQTPIIVLSVRDAETDKIDALDAGADDYLVKPFGPGELLARVRAALRRSVQLENGCVFTSGDLTVDLAAREVRVAERPVQLTPTEYELLKVLVSRAGRIMTHSQLIREVWRGIHYEDALHILRVNISNLRHKLEQDPARPRHITTDSGVGYRLRIEPGPVSAPDRD